MLLSVLKKNDDTHILLVGLSHMNLRLLKERGPAVIDMNRLGFKGKWVVSLEVDGKIVVPQDETVQVLCLKEEQLVPLKEGKVLRLPIEEESFKGEVILFSAPDERTMEEIFHHLIPPGQGSTTCPECRCGFREDGSCSCETSLH